MSHGEFWSTLQALVASSQVVIDRPKGSAHGSPEWIYPLDYGYLDGTMSGDGEGIDVWIGSVEPRMVTAIVCTVDPAKRDAEIKVLLGCSPAEQSLIVSLHRHAGQGALLVTAPDAR